MNDHRTRFLPMVRSEVPSESEELSGKLRDTMIRPGRVIIVLYFTFFVVLQYEANEQTGKKEIGRR